MPRLACLSEVTDRGLAFEDAMNGKVGRDGRGAAVLDRTRVRKWWMAKFPAMVKSIPSEWLPECSLRRQRTTWAWRKPIEASGPARERSFQT